ERREAKLVGREGDEVLPEAREVDEEKRRGEEEFGGGVAVGHRVERVRRGPEEAQAPREGLAIDRKRRSRKRAGAERAFVRARGGVVQAARVAPQHLHVGETPVPERDRLGALPGRVARLRGRGLGLRAPRECEREAARGR